MRAVRDTLASLIAPSISTPTRVAAPQPTEHYALESRLEGAAEAICAKSVRTLDELVVCALIAAHFYEENSAAP